MSHTKTLGILGGMGPMASQLFYQKLVEKTQANCDQDHINLFLYSHATMPDRTQAIFEGRSDPQKWEDMVSLLTTDCLKLQEMGADFLAIPCNTSHFFLHDVEKSLSIPILSMVASTVERVAQLHPHKVAILATEGTISTELYQNHLKTKSIPTFDLPCFLQDTVNHLIYQEIKTGKKGDIHAFSQLETYLLEQEVDCIILACTELSVFRTYHSLNQDLYVDALDVLCEKSIELCGKNVRETQP